MHIGRNSDGAIYFKQTPCAIQRDGVVPRRHHQQHAANVSDALLERRAEPFERLSLDAVLVVAHHIKPEVRVWVCLVALAEHPQCWHICTCTRVRDEAAGRGNRGPATREGLLFHHISVGAALGVGGWLDESLTQRPGGCIGAFPGESSQPASPPSGALLLARGRCTGTGGLSTKRTVLFQGGRRPVIAGWLGITAPPCGMCMSQWKYRIPSLYPRCFRDDARNGFARRYTRPLQASTFNIDRTSVGALPHIHTICH